MTNVAAVVSGIKLAAERKAAEANRRYTALVAELAGGTEHAPEDVIPVLEAAGRTAEELSQDVGLAVQLRDWERAAAGEAELLAAKEAAQAELEAANAAWVTAKEAIDKPVLEAGLRSQRATDALLEARHAANMAAQVRHQQQMVDAKRRKATAARTGTQG